MRRLGVILLAAWLILTGLLPLVRLSFPQAPLVMALLALAAGVLLLVDLRGGKVSANLGVLLLCIWLILQGVLPLIKINIPSSDVILALLALAAGAMILLRRERL